MPVINRNKWNIVDRKTGDQKELDPSKALQLFGPRIPIVLRRTKALLEALKNNPAEAKKISKKEKIEGTALIDTGATHTCIDNGLSSALSLAHVDWVDISTPSHSNHRAKVYAGAELHVPDANLTINLPGAIGSNLKDQGIQVLLGRDVLQHGILIYNGLDGSFSFSF